jgi:hypothetical protein
MSLRDSQSKSLPSRQTLRRTGDSISMSPRIPIGNNLFSPMSIQSAQADSPWIRIANRSSHSPVVWPSIARSAECHTTDASHSENFGEGRCERSLTWGAPSPTESKPYHCDFLLVGAESMKRSSMRGPGVKTISSRDGLHHIRDVTLWMSVAISVIRFSMRSTASHGEIENHVGS